MWNPWERKFWSSNNISISTTEPNTVEIIFERDEDADTMISRFKVVLNGVESDWVDFRGLILDNSPSGIGAGVKGTALRNNYYSHNHVHHFEGKILEVIVLNDELPEVRTGGNGKENYWNLEVWENAPVEEGNVRIYPNPAQSFATLELPLSAENHVEITINTIEGRELRTIQNGTLAQGMNVINIDTDDLQSGMYNLVINIDGKAINKQIVVVK
jgi:hypothetical protein